MLLAGSYLGGHLSFARGVNVNRTAWQEGPAQWTPVLADADLPEGEHRTVQVHGATVLLHRASGGVRALANTCSHMGGPLDEGTVIGPWHGSIFRSVDGSIVRGPASSPQPCYEVRVSGGRIEVRAVA